jgi:hypothetical protein
MIISFNILGLLVIILIMFFFLIIGMYYGYRIGKKVGEENNNQTFDFENKKSL